MNESTDNSKDESFVPALPDKETAMPVNVVDVGSSHGESEEAPEIQSSSSLEHTNESTGSVAENGAPAAAVSVSIKSIQQATEVLTKSAPADGIEILVKLAETGEIDPKNVDITDVTDKFLRAIAAAPKENLRQSGKILFHACVLLRMKAEALLAHSSFSFDSGDDFLDFDDSTGPIIYDSQKQAVGRQITLQDLERALVRKANNRQNRQRRVTLDQLIDALREAERIEKQRGERKPRARIELKGQHEVNDVDDLLDLAHDEDIETTIDRIDSILQNYFQIGELVAIFQLIKLLDRHGDWVDTFLAVLFLSNAGKISLEQEEFWGPLYVIRNQLAEQAS